MNITLLTSRKEKLMLKIAYVMDPIDSINIEKDSTFAMMESAQQRGHHNYFLEPQKLYFEHDQSMGIMQKVTVQRSESYYQAKAPQAIALRDLDAVIMRKDPPFDMNYVYSTYFMERAQQETLMLNAPAALRDANEKLFALNFPQFIPRTVVSSQKAVIKDFVAREGKAILKPIDAMGGIGVFVLRAEDSNVGALIDVMTENQQVPVVVQEYIPEATEGDIRVLMVDGEVISAFRRVPAKGEHRANLNAGGHAESYTLTPEDRHICEQVGPVLSEKGLVFVGLDLIGGKLIEVNVTSPTGIQEARKLSDADTAGALMDYIESKLN